MISTHLHANKVAVPEGAAGTPPFWRGALDESEGPFLVRFLLVLANSVLGNKRKLSLARQT